MPETLQRKSADLDGWNLTDMAAMGACIDELADALPEWRGSMAKNESGAWMLMLNADNPSRSITAFVGDWLVVDLDQLMHFTADQVSTYYNVAGA